MEVVTKELKGRGKNDKVIKVALVVILFNKKAINLCILKVGKGAFIGPELSKKSNSERPACRWLLFKVKVWSRNKTSKT